MDIKSPKDLISTKEAIKAGFIQQAVMKGTVASGYIERAKRFQIGLRKARSVGKILEDIPSFRSEVIAAAGFSVKAAGHLTNDEIEQGIRKALKVFAADEGFREKILHLFLLTMGDAMGGVMRNLVGSLGGQLLVRSVVKELRRRRVSYKIYKNKKDKITGVEWKNRYLFIDVTPKIIGKNIDAILLDTHGCDTIDKQLLEDAKRYIACGELKAGIDPAGADEHWKTANSALERIRSRLATHKKNAKLFFVGAAIEAAMAQEIFDQLKSGKLTNAANLMSEIQLQKLAAWLVGL